jgi:E3 ubiquitin-protein ligase HERC1
MVVSDDETNSDLSPCYINLRTKFTALRTGNVSLFQGPALCDFDEECSGAEEQAHFLEAVLSKQLALARMVCSDSPFAATLQKRLVIVQRILVAVAAKFHDPEKLVVAKSPEDKDAESGVDGAAGDPANKGTDALIEMGVKTGLKLMFSLLQQQWNQGGGGGALCSDVLTTALEVLCSLPPLSLASDSKLAALGRTTLGEVTRFLHATALPRSPADTHGKRLAAQLVLALAAQRGSLRYAPILLVAQSLFCC